MISKDVDELAKELETELLRQIQQARAAAETESSAAEGEAPPYKIGQLLRITTRAWFDLEPVV